MVDASKIDVLLRTNHLFGVSSCYPLMRVLVGAVVNPVSVTTQYILCIIFSIVFPFEKFNVNFIHVSLVYSVFLEHSNFSHHVSNNEQFAELSGHFPLIHMCTYIMRMRMMVVMGMVMFAFSLVIPEIANVFVTFRKESNFCQILYGLCV
jgi:hypothetical protein